MYQRVVVGDHYISYFNTNSFHNEKIYLQKTISYTFPSHMGTKGEIKMFEKRAWATNGEIGPVADQIYEIWTCKIFVIWIFTGESKLCIYTKHLLCSFWMNNRHVQLFNFLILLIIAIFAHLSLQYFYTPTSRSINFCHTKNPLKTLERSVVTKIGSEVGAYVNSEKNPYFAHFNTKVVFRWWWRYLWCHKWRTSLKMTS